MTTATIRQSGSSFIVIDSEGVEHSWDDVKKRVLAQTHESLQCDIRVVRNEQNGNFQLSFADEYFVGVDRNLPREENDRRRSLAIGKRFTFLGILNNELTKMGLKPGDHIAPRDTRQVRNQQSGQTEWRATTQMWLNTPGGTQAAAAAPATDEDLMAKALQANPEKAESILDAEKNFGEDGKLKTVARARLRAIIASASAAKTPSTPAPTKADEGSSGSDDMPTD